MSDIKSNADVNITEQELVLMTEIFDDYTSKHYSLAKRISGSSYGKVSTEEKAKQHKIKADEAQELISKIANEFI